MQLDRVARGGLDPDHRGAGVEVLGAGAPGLAGDGVDVARQHRRPGVAQLHAQPGEPLLGRRGDEVDPVGRAQHDDAGGPGAVVLPVEHAREVGPFDGLAEELHHAGQGLDLGLDEVGGVGPAVEGDAAPAGAVAHEGHPQLVLEAVGLEELPVAGAGVELAAGGVGEEADVGSVAAEVDEPADVVDGGLVLEEPGLVLGRQRPERRVRRRESRGRVEREPRAALVLDVAVEDDPQRGEERGHVGRDVADELDLAPEAVVVDDRHRHGSNPVMRRPISWGSR